MDLSQPIVVDASSLETREELYRIIIAALRLLRKRARERELYVTFTVFVSSRRWPVIVDPWDGYCVGVRTESVNKNEAVVACFWLEEHEELHPTPDGLWCFFRNVPTLN